MEYQLTQPLEKIIPYETVHKLWEMVGADIFTITNKT